MRLWSADLRWNGISIEALLLVRDFRAEEMDMRKLTLTLLAGAGALIASNAYAADVTQIEPSSPLLHQTRLVCNDAGQCWHTRGYYAGPRYSRDYDRGNYYDRGYYERPGIGVYGPGFSFGIGPGY
jgi:hypothetical protein